MPDKLFMTSEDYKLQMVTSAVTEGSVMDVSAEMEVEITGLPLIVCSDTGDNNMQASLYVLSSL